MGFIDLQINGYAGVDFNADRLTRSQVLQVCRRLRDDGNQQILATVITAPIQAMLRRIDHLAELIESEPDVAAMIGGIHVEGPFINPTDGFVGAHPKSAVIPASPDVAARLIDAGRGQVRLVTLAPEMDDDAAVTAALTEAGILVAAGHTDASIGQLTRAIDRGLKLFTHLGNGCPARLARHDNIVQRVLHLSDRIGVSFIADGHHVPDFALANYLDRVPEENIIIVTDAISAAGLGPGQYQLGDQIVEVDDDGAAWAAGREHFAGCATTMQTMVQLLKQRLGATDAQIDQWTRLNPKRLLSMA